MVNLLACFFVVAPGSPGRSSPGCLCVGFLRQPFGLREAFRDAQVVAGRGRHEYTGEHERLIVEESFG